MKLLKHKVITTSLFVFFILLFIFNYSYGVSEVSSKKENKNLEIIYEVKETEEENFLSNIKDNITKDNKEYKYETYEKTGGNKTYSSERSKSDTITLDNNTIDFILDKIPSEYEYSSEDGFNGKLQIDLSSIKIDEILGTAYSYIVSKQQTYTDYNRNDLDSIPKTIIDRGLTYYLITPTWNVTSTEVIDGVEVPATYSGTMNYQSVVNTRYPSKYNVSYTYSGTVEKTEENPIRYIVKYEETSNNNLPIIISSASIVIVIFFAFLIFSKNTKIYNYKDGDYKVIAKVNINKKTTNIDINKYSYKCSSNKFRIKVSKSTINKQQNKELKISYNNKAKTIKIDKIENDFVI